MESNELSQDTQDALCVREEKDPNCMYMPEEPPGPSQRLPGKVCERLVDMFDHVLTLRVEEKASVAKYYAERVHKQEEVLVDTVTFLPSHKEIQRGGHPCTSQERSHQKLSIFDIQQCDITTMLKNEEENMVEIRDENERVHELLESVITSLNLKLSEVREESSRDLAKLEEERLALSATNANITAELDSVRAHKQAGLERLRQALNDVQEMVVFRNEQDKSHADELVRLQALTEKENEEKEILKKVVEDLQKQLEESRTHILIQEDLRTKKEEDTAEKIHKMVESVTASHQVELRESSETNIQNTRKLEEERLALSATNTIITAELDSARAHKQAGLEQLRQALNDVQEMVVFRNEQDKSHADELVRLQALTEKEHEEYEILKKVVEDLQKQLEESRTHILIQEDLRTKKEGDTAEKIHKMVESVTASHQVELRESSEINIQNTRKLEEERLALSATNANITAELDSVRAHKQAGLEQLRQALNDVQEMVVFRNEQDKSHADELVRLQALTEKEHEEYEILKKVVEDLQKQLEESRTHILIQEDLRTKKEGDTAEKIHKMVESVTASHQVELRESSETNIQNTRKLEEERLALSATNANITAELDSVRAHQQAGLEQLRQALNDVQEMVVFRNEQDKSHADELVRLQALTEKEHEEYEILKKVIEDLQKQLEESRTHILIQEDLRTKKEEDTAEKIHKMVESVTASHQVELRESSETNIQNTRKLEEERLALSATNANITAELDSVRAHEQAGLEQLRQALNDVQDMVVFRNEQDKSHADELVRLQALTEEEKEILKRVVEDLQKQLEESRTHILIQEDLRTKKEGDTAEKIHKMVESVTASHQVELRESSETNIQNTRKLEEERLALSATNTIITAELDSARAHKQAGLEQLRQALNDVQEMVVFRNEQDKSHADELVRLQALTEKEHEEYEILKKVVEDLQKQLEESRTHILIQEDLRTKKEGDTAEKIHKMVESVTASHQVELRESSETNIQNTRKLEEERLALSVTNANITAELDSVRAHQQAGLEQLRQALNDVQDMVVFRNEQDKSHAEELVRLQALTEKENEEKEILKRVVEDLQKQLEESRTHILIQEDLRTKKEGDTAEKIHKMVESVTASHQVELRESSEINIQNTRKLEEERLALSATNANITAELDSVRAHKQAGLEQLRQALNDVQEMVVFRNEQDKSHADELVRLQALTEKEHEEYEILKKVVEDLQKQLEESRTHILIQEDLRTKKEEDTAEKIHKMVESVTASHQVELRESSEINIQNTRKLEEERLALSATNANITAELDSVRAHKQAGLEQLRQALNDVQEMVVFRNEQDKSHADELVRLQALTEKEHEEYEILKKVVEDLQKQLEESRTHILIQEDLRTKKEEDTAEKIHKMVESVTASHQVELRESSEINIQNTRKLEEERLALSATNANITAELDSVRAHKQAGLEQLRQALNDVQEMVVFRNEQDKSHADELVRLQALTEKEHEEYEILKKVVEDLQKQLEESRTHILIQEDLRTKKEGDTAEKIHKMVESVTASHQVELRESSETNIQNTRKLEEERLALSATNANITAELDSVRAHQQAGLEQLRQALNDVQEMVVFRNEQDKSHADELVRLQALTEKENEEKEILKKVVEDLQKQLEESRTHILIQEDLRTKKEGDTAEKIHKMVESVTASHQVELRESSETNIQNTRKLEEERLALSATNANITAELDSVRAHEQAGLEQLRQALNDVQEMVVFRNEQDKSHADELVRLQALTEKENEEKEILKKVVEDLQKQLEESRTHILIQEDLRTKKEGDTAEKIHKMVESVTASHQVELRESSETNIQNTRKLEEERLALSATNANITAELDSVRAHEQAGLEQLRQALNDVQEMVVFRNEQDKSHADELVRLQALTEKEHEEYEILKRVVEDLQKQLEESRTHILIQEDRTTKKEGDIPESPLDEDETRSVWRYRPKGPLRFALQVGVGALVTVTGGIILASLDAFNSDCNGSQSSYVSSLLTSFCDFMHVAPPPY
ncbi:trichohyalin-like [Pseudochaenichthys georgianus]|uniref:trichohyalin-like n=1 Tax=Pseudochaenichthys georgianus TaxID=52239 RepID=UPI00146D3127|nr:plectin-like [Pseudochaenichthys georgianus]